MVNTKDEIITYVYKTTDYSKFKLLSSNREIDHVGYIKRSMEERLVPSPIVVNENYEIIDGQNRFEALRQLGKPVLYVMFPDLGIEDVRAINRGSRNWQKKDFIKSYADEGIENYVAYVDFLKSYPDFSPGIAEIFLRMSNTNDSDLRRKESFQSIQSGNFIIKDFKRSCQLADMVMRYKGLDDNRRPIYKRKEFVIAIIKLARLPEFNNDKMVGKVKLNLRKFVPCTSVQEYVLMLEEIYNYKNRKKVRFVV